MTDTPNDANMNKALFANLVMMLSSSAMQQLGKLVNPLTGKTEVHLEGAQVSIDMLAMIQSKTEGNLDDEEKQMLENMHTCLASFRLSRAIDVSRLTLLVLHFYRGSVLDKHSYCNCRIRRSRSASTGFELVSDATATSCR